MPAQRDLADLTTAALPVRLPASAGWFMLALWQSRGRVVSYDDIAERIWNATAHRPSEGAVKTSAKRLRRVIEQTGWPVSLESHYSIGYRLIVLAPGWSWKTTK